MALIDILGTEGATADPGHIASIASRFESVARDSDHARHLLSTGSPIQWTGPASDLFKQHLSQLPQELSKVSLSIGHAAGALWTYSHSLEDILQQARSLSTQLEQVRRDLAVNRRLLSTATDPTQVKHLNEQVANLKGEERATQNKAGGLRTWLSDAAAVCVNQISQAGEAGMQNSWTRTIKDEVAGGLWVAGYVFDHVIKAVEIFGNMVWAPVAELNTTVRAFIADPSWTTAAPMFRAAATVTGEVALIATIVALTLTGVGAPAAGALIGVAADFAGSAALGLGVATVVSDGGMIATGKKVSVLEVAGDVMGVGLGAVSLGSGVFAEKQLAQGAGKEAIAGAAKLTLAERVQATVAAKGVELQGQVAELRVLGRLDVLGKDANGTLPIPLVTHVQTYLELDKHFVNMRFAVATVVKHISDNAPDVIEAVQNIGKFEKQYGQAVAQ